MTVRRVVVSWVKVRPGEGLVAVASPAVTELFVPTGPAAHAHPPVAGRPRPPGATAGAPTTWAARSFPVAMADGRVAVTLVPDAVSVTVQSTPWTLPRTTCPVA